MTYRDRQEARIAQLREWANSHRTKADAIAERNRFDSPERLAQPLIGRTTRRVDNSYDQEREHREKAATFRRQADELERATKDAIYDDDTDALERLVKKLADKEALRLRVKEHNELNPSERLEPYVLTNLGKEINRLKKRLSRLTQPS